MSMNQVYFTLTRLNGTNKVGELKQKPDGYYPMVVGALNMFNSAGMYYREDAAREFFEGNSELMRRVKKGVLRGENGHPRMDPGMSERQYFARLLTLWEDRLCCQFGDIRLDYENYKDDQGRPIVAILADVTPSGELAYVLEKQLKNPRENVCFSIRSFTHDYMERGVVNRAIKKIVTFDLVNEPGMSIADKYNSPALESVQEAIVFSRGTIESAVRDMATKAAAAGNESTLIGADDLFDMMGWDKKAIHASSHKLVKSAWSGW